MRFRVLLSAVLVTTALAPVAARADHGSPCRDLTVVFARGSGQGLGGREVTAFFDRLLPRITGYDIGVYELGTETHGGGQYPAVGIGFDSAQAWKNLLEADMSWTDPATPNGMPEGQYRESVASGVAELSSYLTDRAVSCPYEQFVVGGYSQGAQVVGDALRQVTPYVRQQIAFVPLFGDPKLYLPEGRGPWPPACRGKEFSKWRRGNVSCWTDNGILEARKPYVPDDLEYRVGSWCDREDGICNNNPGDIVVGSAHGKYADPGEELDEAVAEAAERLSVWLPAHTIDDDPEPEVVDDDPPPPPPAVADGSDVAFVIDTTGSMTDDIASAVAVANEVGQSVVDVNGRVALTEYRDFGDPFVARIKTPLTTDIAAYQSALAGLVADGGGDTPEATLTALMTTFNGLDWRPGATKAAIVLTDAGYHDPDLAEGWTTADVVQRSLEIDPVNVYPVVPSYLTSSYQPLADATAGQLIVNGGDTAAALTAAFDEVTTRPVVYLDFDEYYAPNGESIDFHVKAYDVDSTIVGYDWDFDGNGTIDLTTTTPTASHTYPASYSGRIEVRARSADGGIGSSTALVTVDALTAAGLDAKVPGQPVGLTAVSATPVNGERTVTLSWQTPATGGAVEHWKVLDAAGNVLGTLPAADRSTSIVSVPNTTVGFSVVAGNGYGDGVPATVTVPPVQALTVTSLSPPGGVVAGGTPVTIKGTGFAAGATVKFGTKAATNVVVNSSSSITATSPSGVAGFVYVTVTTAAGTSPTGPASQFLYGSVPTVKSLTPKSISSNSTVTLTVSGTGFVPGYTKVSVDGNDPATGGRTPATITSTSLTLPITAGCYRNDWVIDVRVWTPVGTSATSTSTKLTYKQSNQSCIEPPPR